jgi:glucose-1-phosphate thymidylyltransferase
MEATMEDIVGLIPAAGKGLRLGLPYPKELYPVIRNNHYTPIAQFVVKNLTSAGSQHIVFVINETKHQLIGYFGDGHRFGCNFSYVVQEQRGQASNSTSPGLAHALDSAYHLIQGKTVFFGMADTIVQPFNAFDCAYQASAADDDAILVLFTTDYPQKFGMVEMDQDGRVARIVDKPSKTHLTEMWGGIIWRPKFTEFLHDCVRQREIADFAQIMNYAISEGLRFRGVHIRDGVYVDLGTYDEIAELDRRFREE